MKCHQCNQKSIKIHNKHILCDVCGLDIDVSHLSDNSLYDLFIYNENLDAAYQLGQEAYSENLKNPYSTNADQVALYNQWENGYIQEKLSYDYIALSLSSEKIESELRADIEILRAEIVDKDDQIYGLATLYKDLRAKVDKFVIVNYNTILNFCSKLLRIKILGRLIRKDIDQFKKEYKKFYEDSWDNPE